MKLKLRSRNVGEGNVFNIICYHCKKEGHKGKFCPNRQKKANHLDRSFGPSRLSRFDNKEERQVLIISMLICGTIYHSSCSSAKYFLQ